MVYHGTVKKLSIGYNSDREVYPGCGYGRHSEVDAILKLKKNTDSRLIVIDMFVTRVSKTGKRGNSLPCQKCRKHMHRTARKKGYLVRHVYYTNSEGDIVCEKFTDLWNNRDNYISSHFLKSGRYKLTSSTSSDSESSDEEPIQLNNLYRKRSKRRRNRSRRKRKTFRRNRSY